MSRKLICGVGMVLVIAHSARAQQQPRAGAARRDEHAKAQMLIGCWKVEPGRFSVIGTTGVDPGQTIMPSLVQFDTVPGKSWTGEPLGHLVHALAGNRATRYRNGYYLLSGADSVRVE